MRRPKTCVSVARILGTAGTVLTLVTAVPAAGTVMYGANCLTGLTQWSQEPDAEGHHQRLTAPIPIDDATRAWCEAEFAVSFETVPVQLDDGRPWYRLRATHPATLTIGDPSLFDQLELGE